MLDSLKVGFIDIFYFIRFGTKLLWLIPIKLYNPATGTRWIKVYELELF